MAKRIEEGAPDDVLIKDSAVRAEFGDISEDTLKSWDDDPELGFAPKLTIRNRNYRSRRALDEFKARLLQQALKKRKHA